MNSDGDIVPIVEDDQGEGFKDVFESYAEALNEKNHLMSQFNPFKEILKTHISNKTANEIRRVIPDVKKR